MSKSIYEDVLKTIDRNIFELPEGFGILYEIRKKIEQALKQAQKQEFLVVYEDIWSNKESIRTDQIGDAIKSLVDSYELTPENEIDYDKYNSEDPYDVGTTGLGFFDISLIERYGEDEEYAGRIMIFGL